MSRTFLGLSVGSGLEGVDAVAVRVTGLGLDLTPRVVPAGRAAFPPAVRDLIKSGSPGPPPPEFMRGVADTAVFAARQALGRAAVSPRDAFAAGFLDPARPAAPVPVRWPEVAGRVAEQLGVTVLHGFADRDRAAGGSGHPLAAVADFLLFRDETETRLLLHLGAVTAALLVPARGTVSTAFGFETGPGNQLLDAVLYHGSRGKEFTDAGFWPAGWSTRTCSARRPRRSTRTRSGAASSWPRSTPPGNSPPACPTCSARPPTSPPAPWATGVRLRS
jgi:anhydro-N-acetylmuramic acid kinase